MQGHLRHCLLMTNRQKAPLKQDESIWRNLVSIVPHLDYQNQISCLHCFAEIGSSGFQKVHGSIPTNGEREKKSDTHTGKKSV